MSPINLELCNHINNFISNGFSALLLESVEAAGTLKGTMISNPSSALLTDLLILNEVRFANLLSGKDGLPLDYFIKDSYREYYERFLGGQHFLNEKIAKYNIVLGTDVMRVSEYIKSGKTASLTDTLFTGAYSLYSDQINDALNLVYDDYSACHSFIKAAIFYICTANSDIPLEPLVFYFICNHLINQNANLVSLSVPICPYILQNGPFLGQVDSVDMESVLTRFLEYLKQVFIMSINTLQDIKRKFDIIKSTILMSMNENTVQLIMNLLQRKIVFSTNELREVTNASYRTTLNYLSRLRESGIIESYPLGKEKIHINRQILFCLEGGDLFYGAQESKKFV